MPRRKTAEYLNEIANAEPSSLLGFVAPYLEHLRVRNFSLSTIRNRGYYLAVFGKWLYERDVKRPQDVTPLILEGYRRFLFHHHKRNGESLSARSQHAHLLPVRAFFKWMARGRHLLYNPASELELPRLEKRLPKAVLSIEEMEQLLCMPDLTEPLGLRNRAMMEVLYSTGMRRGELVGLLLHDLDKERGTIFIRQGKGKKDRVIPIGERALLWVDKYITDVRPFFVVGPDIGFLFLTQEGGGIAKNRLTGMMVAYLNTSGIAKKGACHLLRHTCATLMLEGGADIRYIQQLLGHSSLTTTEIYTQVSIQKLKAVHTLTHPAKAESHHGKEPASLS